MSKTDTPSEPASTNSTMSTETAQAKMALRPAVNAAWVITDYDPKFEKLNICALIDELGNSITEVADGKMNTCEAMLLSQAYALQSIFTGLSNKAVEQSQLRQYSALLKLALKAQSQCRTTLETLANLKKPPAIFANQANIAQGHQQVNNTVCPLPVDNAAEKINSAQNELLEVQDGQRLEPRTQSQTGSSHTPLETMAKINRPKVSRRKAKSVP